MVGIWRVRLWLRRMVLIVILPYTDIYITESDFIFPGVINLFVYKSYICNVNKKRIDMESRGYIIELVGKFPPHISLGYVGKRTLSDGVLCFAGSKSDALVIRSRYELGVVLCSIYIHNTEPYNVSVMGWITEIGSNKRLFSENIKF